MTFITTYPTGKRFHFDNIRTEDISMADVAHALSMICRFGGHAAFHYSVAQHSVLAAYAAMDSHDTLTTLHVLLHDAAEAYIGDIVRPRKTPQDKWYEGLVLHAIYKAIGVPGPTPEQERIVKYFDDRMLATEQPILVPNDDGWWIDPNTGIDYRPEPLSNISISEWAPEAARHRFQSELSRLLFKYRLYEA